MSQSDSWPKLYVMNADGANVSALTSGIGELIPAWSPVGLSIVYVDIACCVYDYFGAKSAHIAGLAVAVADGSSRSSFVGYVSHPALAAIG
jgi:Tol biopolymer transport system component